MFIKWVYLFILIFIYCPSHTLFKPDCNKAPSIWPGQSVASELIRSLAFSLKQEKESRTKNCRSQFPRKEFWGGWIHVTYVILTSIFEFVKSFLKVLRKLRFLTRIVRHQNSLKRIYAHSAWTSCVAILVIEGFYCIREVNIHTRAWDRRASILSWII